jgi:hypothetical protein
VPAFQQTGKWYEYFTEDSISVTNVNANITLQPGEFKLYSTRKLGSPKLTLAIEDHYLPSYEEFVTAYPNPSSGIVSFEINNVIPVPVTLTVFDISGRMIRQIRTGNIPDGRQVITWDGKTENGSDAGSGVYLVSIKTPLRMQTIKVIRK